MFRPAFPALLLALLGACAEPKLAPSLPVIEDPGPSGASTEAQAIWDAARAQQNLDEIFLALEQELPGFAGFHLNGDQRLVLSVSGAFDRQQEPLLLDVGIAIRHTYQPRPPEAAPQPPVEVRDVTFSFGELSRALASVRDSLGSEGIAFVDLDELRNTVSIGVSDEGTQERVREVWTRAALPADMLYVHQTQPFETQAAP